jgi:hypothetical protein
MREKKEDINDKNEKPKFDLKVNKSTFPPLNGKNFWRDRTKEKGKEKMSENKDINTTHTTTKNRRNYRNYDE